MKKETKVVLWAVAIYAAAMGLLESAVVVYLRYLYYPLGFSFPLQGVIDPRILSVEWAREIATLVMLAAVGFIAGKRIKDKIAYFLFAFAVWDIFYYAFLKVFLGWPESLLTWDLLFMIPWPWAGPVIAPVLCAIGMIIAAFLLLSLPEKKKVGMKTIEITGLIVGTLFILYTWLYDYGKLLVKGHYLKDFFSLDQNQQFSKLMNSYIPANYQWLIFFIGFAIICASIAKWYSRVKKR